MKQLETFLKLIIIGILTALVRAYAQGFIPVVEDPLFWPSIFVEGEIELLAFIVFGSIFYTAIAALFLMMERNMKGHKLFKGLKFSLFLIIIWIAYILEPLPYVILTDKIAYSLVDGGALLILGVLTGLFLGTRDKNKGEIIEETIINSEDEESVKNNELGTIVDNILSLAEDELEEHNEIEQEGAMVIGKVEGQEAEINQRVRLWKPAIEDMVVIDENEDLNKGCQFDVKRGKLHFSVLNIIIIGLIFFLGRIAMYKYFSIYSFFGTHAVETVIWILLTGLAIGVVYEMTASSMCTKAWYLRFLVFGVIYLAVILMVFSGFKLLIYRMDLADLALRIIGDVASVVLAGGICLLFDFKRNISKSPNL